MKVYARDASKVMRAIPGLILLADGTLHIDKNVYIKTRDLPGLIYEYQVI
jgi:hypothetical protein